MSINRLDARPSNSLVKNVCSYRLICHVAIAFFVAVGWHDGGLFAQDNSRSSSSKQTSTVIAELRHVIDSQLEEGLSRSQLVAVHRLYEEQLRSIKGKILEMPNGHAAFGEELSRVARFYYKNTDDLETAVRLYDEIATGYEDEYVGAHANLVLGWIRHANENDQLGAVEYFEKTLAFFKENPPKGNPRRIGVALRTLNTAGDVYMIMGDDKRAIEMYEQVLDDKSLTSDGVGGATRLNAAEELAQLLIKKEDYRNALDRLRQAEELLDKSGLPDDFKLLSILNLWAEKAKISPRAGERFSFNIEVLEELFYGLQQKDSVTGLQVGNLLLLCYRFGGDTAEKSKIPDFANVLIQLIAESSEQKRKLAEGGSPEGGSPEGGSSGVSGIAGKAKTNSFRFKLAQQSRLLRIEELKRSGSQGDRTPDKEIEDYIEILTESNYPRFNPVVSSRLPNGIRIRKNLVDIYERLIESKIMQSVLSSDDEIVVTNRQLRGAGYEIEVGYKSSENRDVVVELWKGKVFLGRAREKVERGEGTIALVVSPNQAIVSGDDYVVKAGIRPTNATWREIISGVTVDKVKVEIESITIDREHSLEFENIRKCKVHLHHSLLKKVRDVKVEVYKGDRWLGNARTSFSGPERKVIVPVMLTHDLTEGDDYSIKAILFPLREKDWKKRVNSDEIESITLKMEK